MIFNNSLGSTRNEKQKRAFYFKKIRAKIFLSMHEDQIYSVDIYT